MKRLGMGVVLLSIASPLFSWDLNNVDWQKAASGGTKLVKAATGLSDAEEIKLGRQVAANLAARYGLVEDPAKLQYLHRVGLTLAGHSTRTKLSYHFGILKSPEFNAFAAPGGYIFVTEGLLTFLKDEAELAGVLAHEISHVTEQHIVKAIRQANLIGAGQDLASAAGQESETWGPLTDFSVNMLEKGYSRKDELEADREGTLLAAATGYDPRGLYDSVTRLGLLKGSNAVFGRFSSTHPPAADRVKEIEKALKKIKEPTDIRLAERYAKNIPSPTR